MLTTRGELHQDIFFGRNRIGDDKSLFSAHNRIRLRQQFTVR